MRKLFITLLLIYFSPDLHSQNIESVILGDWGYFAEPDSFFNQNDSIYIEIYFEADTLTIDSRVAGVSPPIRYKIENESLFTESISKRDSTFRFQYHISIINNDKIRFYNKTQNYLLFRIDSSEFTISNWINEYNKIYGLRFEKELYDSLSILIDNRYEAQIRKRELKKRIETNKLKKDEAIEIINSFLTDDDYKEQYDLYKKLKTELEKKN